MGKMRVKMKVNTLRKLRTTLSDIFYSEADRKWAAEAWLSQNLSVVIPCCAPGSSVVMFFFLFVYCSGQCWFKLEVGIPMAPCATSPSSSTTTTTLTVRPRAGETTWNGAEPRRTTTPTRSLGSAPWLVRWSPHWARQNSVHFPPTSPNKT